MRQQSYVILADMDSVADFAAGLAYKVGEFLHQNFKTDGTPAYLKADRSAVTEIDLAADRLVTDEIHRNFPTDGLLSEELQPVHKSGYSATWVVDPLDGTTNYSLGLPIWGVSIARLVDGIPEIAAVHFPPLN